MKKKKGNEVPAHLVLELMAKGIFINSGDYRMGVMEQKMKQALKGGEHASK